MVTNKELHARVKTLLKWAVSNKFNINVTWDKSGVRVWQYVGSYDVELGYICGDELDSSGFAYLKRQVKKEIASLRRRYANFATL